MAWSKFISPFTRTGRRDQKKRVDCLVDKSSVNEEYTNVLRTDSYIDILNKVQDHESGKKCVLDTVAASSPSSSSCHLSEYLLQPSQETLIDLIERSNLHHLLIDYFEASSNASNACELLLSSIHQARANYLIIKRVIKLAKRMGGTTNYSTNAQCHAIFKELALFTTLKNPMQIISPVQFQDIHDNQGLLLHKLTVQFRKVSRRLKFNRFCKTVAGFSLVVSYSALVIAVLVLAAHSAVGILAAPGLIACSLGLLAKRRRIKRRGLETGVLERLGTQLEVAAKGIFILINDFDTMSQLVRRLQDEIEHSKGIADMCVKNGKSNEVMMEVVKEFRMHQEGFLEQLEELEEHIYLCFLTINRSRMLVVQEILVLKQVGGV